MSLDDFRTRLHLKAFFFTPTFTVVALRGGINDMDMTEFGLKSEWNMYCNDQDREE